MNTLEIKPPETTPEHNTLDGSHTVIVRVAVPDEIATLTGQFPAGNFVGTTLLAQAIIAQVGASLPQVHHYNELNKALIIIACGHLPLETVKEAALSVLKKCRLEKFAVIAYAHLAEDFFPELHRGEMAILLPQHTRQSFLDELEQIRRVEGEREKHLHASMQLTLSRIQQSKVILDALKQLGIEPKQPPPPDEPPQPEQ